MPALTIDLDAPSPRKCGECTLCCRLLPVDLTEGGMNKPANQKCKHQCSKGCRVYQTPAMPIDCHFWRCQWLMGEDVGQRPDRSHVVVDILLDGVRVTLNSTGEHTPVPAVQLWCDPEHKDAHRNPTLRKWLNAFCAKHHALVVVRYSSTEAIVLFPPSMTQREEWTEMESNVRARHDLETIKDQLALGMLPTG